MVVAATMASMDDHERKIVVEFCQLLEQSKQLFNGLRWVVIELLLDVNLQIMIYGVALRNNMVSCRHTS